MSRNPSENLLQALRSGRYLASASLIAGLSFSLAPTAWAQDATGSLATDETQTRSSSRSAEESEIVVTGSLFRQRENQSNLVTVQTREDLERRGVTSATEALASLAQNQPLTVPQTTAFSGTGFASYANLRSLGSANTLVLLNGKRVVNNPFQAQGVDLNTIPLALIERVETLADGASSIYGSDAVAGVINFITRDTVEGVRASGTTLFSEKGGGARYNASLAAGLGDYDEQGFNVFVAGTYRKQQQLLQRERDFARSYFLPAIGVNRLNAATFPGNYSQGTISGNPSRAAGCEPPFSLPNGATLCGSDAAIYAQSILPEENYSFVVHGSVNLGGAKLTADYFWARAELISQTSPQALNNLTVCPRETTAPAPSGCNNSGALNPFFPGNGIYPAVAGINPATGVTVSLRPPEFGPVRMSPKTDTDRALIQLDGDLGAWKYSVWGLRSTSTARLSFLSGVYNYAALRDGFAGRNGTPFLNPFGPQSAAAMAYVNSTALTGEMQRAESELWMAGASFAGTVFQLPGGDAQLALAADYSDDKVSFTVNPAIRGAVGTGIDTSVATAGSRTAYSLTGELRLPILDILRLDGALRYDHYSDFGSTVNPKILATLEPVDWLEIHGSYNTGFRAPTLYNLFSSVTYPLSATRQSDPVLCTGGVVQAGGVASRDCNIQFPNQRGGNLDLGPEKTSAYAFGVKLRPTDGLQIQIDYWNYLQKGTIGVLNESVVFANPTQFASLLVRCGSVPNPAALGLVNCTNAAGNPIAYVVQTLQNLGNTKTSGFDLKLAWRGPEWSFGRISFTYNGTVVDKFLFQREPNGQYFSRKGAYLDGSVVSKYNHYATLIWDKGAFSGQISNRFTSGYTDCNAQCIGASATAVALYRDVEAYSVWDIGFTYRLNERFSLTGRVSNVFDTDPPLTNKTQGLTTGYDERYGDPLGRAYSISITANF